MIFSCDSEEPVSHCLQFNSDGLGLNSSLRFGNLGGHARRVLLEVNLYISFKA